MDTHRAVVSLLAASMLALFMTDTAVAQQSKAQQKCINKLNKDTRKVAAKQGKENFSCVKQARKGAAAAGCLTLDPKGTVADAKQKTNDDETKHECLAANAPGFGYSDSTTGNNAAQSAEIDLFVDVYGTSDPTMVISSAKTTGKCQAAVTKDIEKLIATKWKTYLKCKKKTLKAGATSVAALEACLSGDPNSVAADPKGKISKRLAKLDNDITTKKCTAEVVSTTFPGDCSGSALAGLAACLDARVECRFCLAVVAIDELTSSCDLFDDGMSNESCFNTTPIP